MTAKRYSGVAVALHWLIAAAIVLQALLGWRLDGLVSGERSAVLQAHKSVGITMLLLALARLAWRWRHAPPPAEPAQPGIERLLAKAIHAAFYLILVGLPLTGWAMVSMSRGGATLRLFGLVPWPRLPGLHALPAATQDALVGFFDVAHQAMVWATVVLLVLHVAGALKHQFVSCDTTLARMMPWLRPGVRWDARLLAIPVVAAFAAVAAYAPRQLAADAMRPRPTTLASADLFLDVVQPALAHRCETCHNDERTRGGFSVQGHEALIEGGLHGHTVVAGKPEGSELLRRLRLPATDELAMPRNGHTPLTAEQSRLVEWWIAQGAPASASIGSLEPAPELRAALVGVLGFGVAGPAFVLAATDENAGLPQVPAADGKAIAELEESGFVVRGVAQDSNLLDVVYAKALPLTDAQLKLLEALAPQVLRLNLRKTQLGDAGLARIAGMQHLRRLRLEWNPIGDSAAAVLASFKELRYLNLTGTRMSDRGLEALASLPRLQRLALWQSGATPAGVAALKKRNPGLAVEMGVQLRAGAAS